MKIAPRVIIRKDDEVKAIVDDENEAFAWLLSHQSQSVDWACKHEGWSYGVAQPWDADDKHHHHVTAVQCFQHFRGHTAGQLERENCSGCVLEGYEPRGGYEPGYVVKHHGPNYAGWARIYVEARRAIPENWRHAFDQERRRTDNLHYTAALERSIATFGVSFR